MSDPTTDTPFLTLDEAAAYLRMSPRWLEASDCPRIKLGRRVLWDRVELEKFARAHATLPHVVTAA